MSDVVNMADHRYEKLVEKGRELTARASKDLWALADLALEVETSYGGGQLKSWAEEVGVSYSRAKQFRQTAQRFSEKDRRLSISFDHHQQLASSKVGDPTPLLEQAERDGLSARELKSVAFPARTPDEESTEGSQPPTVTELARRGTMDFVGGHSPNAKLKHLSSMLGRLNGAIDSCQTFSGEIRRVLDANPDIQPVGTATWSVIQKAVLLQNELCELAEEIRSRGKK